MRNSTSGEKDRESSVGQSPPALETDSPPSTGSAADSDGLLAQSAAFIDGSMESARLGVELLETTGEMESMFFEKSSPKSPSMCLW